MNPEWNRCPECGERGGYGPPRLCGICVDRKTVMRAGDVVYLTKGSYSEYGVIGIFIVARECVRHQVDEEYLAYEKQAEPLIVRGLDSSYPLSFARWLEEHGYVREIDASEWTDPSDR